jgi:secreted trypsin-like serine protease
VTERRRSRSIVGGLALLLLAGLLAVVPGAAGAQTTGDDDNGGAVVGGEPIEISEAPFQVALLGDVDLSDDSWWYYQFCGGTILSEWVVMTAAHCIRDDATGEDTPASSLSVLAGSDDLDDTSVLPVQVARWAIHPRYVADTSTDPAAYTDDVAYLLLEDPLTFSDDVQPIATADGSEGDLVEDGDPSVTSGWGATVEAPDSSDDYPALLHAVEVPIVGDDECIAAYEDHAEWVGTDIDADVQVCAGTATEDSCYGDSGGPLWVDDAGTPLQVGIVSWGPELCADDDAPGVYSEVGAFAALTQAHVAAAEEPPFTDVTFGHPFLTEIFQLEDQGIVGGYPDGTYRSGNPVTRQAMSAFLYRLAGEPVFSDPATATFGDVSTAHPFFSEIEWMVAEDISIGYADGTYRPAAPVTRQSMAAFLFRMAGEPIGPWPDGSFSDVGPAHPFLTPISWLADTGVSTGYADGTFRPAAPVSRQAMAAFLYRMLDVLLT